MDERERREGGVVEGKRRGSVAVCSRDRGGREG